MLSKNFVTSKTRKVLEMSSKIQKLEAEVKLIKSINNRSETAIEKNENENQLRIIKFKTWQEMKKKYCLRLIRKKKDNQT